MNNKTEVETSAQNEESIILAVKQALTMVIRDTATAPGLKHPLNDETIIYIRKCLAFISAREQELALVTGRDLSVRPRFIDEPSSNGVVVQFDTKKN